MHRCIQVTAGKTGALLAQHPGRRAQVASGRWNGSGTHGTLAAMATNSLDCGAASRRGIRVLLGLLGALLAGLPAAAQETEIHKDVPYVPTPPKVVESMLKLGKVGPGDVIYDLGCGDGRIVIAALQKFGAARGIGYDIDPQRIKEANENAVKAGVADRAKFIVGNLFDADFHDATVVSLFLLPEVNMKLRPILLRQLNVGARILSHQWDLGDWRWDSAIVSDWQTLYTPEGGLQVACRTQYVWTVTEKAKALYAE